VSDLAFDPFDPETIECPYAFYAALRDGAPVFRMPRGGHFVVSRFEDARAVAMNRAPSPRERSGVSACARHSSDPSQPRLPRPGHAAHHRGMGDAGLPLALRRRHDREAIREDTAPYRRTTIEQRSAILSDLRRLAAEQVNARRDGDLALFKMLFFGTKDVLDVERLVALVGGDFDRAYVRRWLVDLVGADDERVQRWDRLLSDVDG